jgi:hypothetical protein
MMPSSMKKPLGPIRKGLGFNNLLGCGGVDLNHRPLGYEGNVASKTLHLGTTNYKETLRNNSCFFVPRCFVLYAVFGQYSDNDIYDAEVLIRITHVGAT